MKPTKAMILAGLAAVSLGAAMASARDLTPGSGLAGYFEEQKKALPALLNSGAVTGLDSSGTPYSSGSDGMGPPYYFNDIDIGRGF